MNSRPPRPERARNAATCGYARPCTPIETRLTWGDACRVTRCDSPKRSLVETFAAGRHPRETHFSVVLIVSAAGLDDAVDVGGVEV